MSSHICKMSLKSPPEVMLRPFFQYSKARLSPILGLRQCTSISSSDDSVIKSIVCKDFSAPLSIEHHHFAQKLQKYEICIDVKYAAVNFADILLCKGQYQSNVKPPFSPGMEMSGVIRDVGSLDVEQQYNLRVGDRVMGLGTERLGAYAERCIVSAENVWKVPEEMPLDTAAAIPTSYGTALLALQRRARIKAGDKVLITAAAGSVGLAAVDIAKYNDAYVLGACGSSEKCSVLLKRGADCAIDYQHEDIKQKIKEVTDGKGVDIVIDCVGGKLFSELVKCLAPEGRLVVIGFASGSIGEVRSNLLLLKNCDVIGVWWGQYNEYGGSYREIFKQTIQDSIDLCASKQLSPYVGKVFNIDEINEAMQYIVQRRSIGKVLIKVGL